MKIIYEEKRDCEFCNKAGQITIFDLTVRFADRELLIKSHIYQPKPAKKVCPLCEGKGYLHILLVK
ncbi:MAG: hypothetical protein PVG65_00485 [Candidatus Thorarchaeota archaeon]|jgi:hypothetical protein